MAHLSSVMEGVVVACGGLEGHDDKLTKMNGSIRSGQDLNICISTESEPKEERAPHRRGNWFDVSRTTKSFSVMQKGLELDLDAVVPVPLHTSCHSEGFTSKPPAVALVVGSKSRILFAVCLPSGPYTASIHGLFYPVGEQRSVKPGQLLLLVSAQRLNFTCKKSCVSPNTVRTNRPGACYCPHWEPLHRRLQCRRCLCRLTAGDWLRYGKHSIAFMGVFQGRCEMSRAVKDADKSQNPKAETSAGLLTFVPPLHPPPFALLCHLLTTYDHRRLPQQQHPQSNSPTTDEQSTRSDVFCVSFSMILEALEGTVGPLQPCILLEKARPPICVLKLWSENKRGNIKHTTGSPMSHELQYTQSDLNTGTMFGNQILLESEDEEESNTETKTALRKRTFQLDFPSFSDIN
ncbi:uncharacterized protein V6R79_003211 [Siganus canaliculatus]